MRRQTSTPSRPGIIQSRIANRGASAACIASQALVRLRRPARRSPSAPTSPAGCGGSRHASVIQAEIMLLLASEPEDAGARDAAEATGDDAPGTAAPPSADWRTALPRPGALFVVGDPKQSIYRFRRADIQLYEFVKERFRAFGDVLELTSNFRSRPADRRPGQRGLRPPRRSSRRRPPRSRRASSRFGRDPRRGRHRPKASSGTRCSPMRRAYAAVAEDDAGRLATWIRDRLDAGERGGRGLPDPDAQQAGPRDLRPRAWRPHGIPVQVTGAGVGVELELDRAGGAAGVHDRPHRSGEGGGRAGGPLLRAGPPAAGGPSPGRGLVRRDAAGRQRRPGRAGGARDAAPLVATRRAASRRTSSWGGSSPSWACSRWPPPGSWARSVRARSCTRSTRCARRRSPGTRRSPARWTRCARRSRRAEAEAPLEPGPPGRGAADEPPPGEGAGGAGGGARRPVASWAARPRDMHVERRPDGTAVGWLAYRSSAAALRRSHAPCPPPGVAGEGGGGGALRGAPSRCASSTWR